MMSKLSNVGAAVTLCLLGVGVRAGEVTSEDASVRWDANFVDVQTATVAHRFKISAGALTRVAWVDRKSGDDLLQNRSCEDFRLQVDGKSVSSSEPGWRIETPACEKLTHGELRLRLQLTRDDLRVVRYYVAYPRLSLIRGWLEITMLGKGPLVLNDPPLAAFSTVGAPVDLKWMSGAELLGDSWRLRTERLGPDARKFDSYDPPPTLADVKLPGDGVDVRIVHNGQPIWPAEGWAHSATFRGRPAPRRRRESPRR